MSSSSTSRIFVRVLLSLLVIATLATLTTAAVRAGGFSFLNSVDQFFGVERAESLKYVDSVAPEIAPHGNGMAAPFALNYSVTVSPTTAATGVAQNFTFNVTAGGANCGAEGFRVFGASFPAGWTVNSASVVSASGKNWAAVFTASTVTASANANSDKLCSMTPLLVVSVNATSPGAPTLSTITPTGYEDLAQTNPFTLTGPTPTINVVVNAAPVASAVAINDTTPTYGQTLTGSYTYTDADGDLQGTSTFRWLRNGVTQVGTSLNYTVVGADVGQTLTFEVTPVAATGTSPGTAVQSAASAPVAKAVLNVNAVAASKIYGDADPGLTASYTGFIPPDNAGNSGFTGAPSCTRAAGETVGTYTITCTPNTLAAPNYTFVAGTTAVFTINVRPVTVTADAKTKVYGDADPALTFTTTSLGTGIAISGALTRAAGEDVGVYAIQQGTVTNANNTNYSITYVGANLTITARPVTVTADAQTKVYGDADPTLTFTTTSLGAGVAIAGALTRVAGENVGAYAIQQGTVTDANNPNYSITYVGANLTINVRPVTVTADPKTKVYGDADPALTFTTTSLGTGVAIAGALTRTAGEDIGLYAILQGTITNANNPNYSITYVGADLTITVRPVTVTADAQTKVYGDADPALTFTTSSLGTGSPIAGALTRAAGEDVGVYAILQGTVTNANNPNYSITYVGANFTITGRPVTVTADAKTKVYGDADPALTFTTTSIGSGVPIVGALTRAAGENVGLYAIQQGTVTNANNPNYSITYVGANLTITARPVTVTADAKTKVYGDADPALTFTTTSLGTGVAINGALTRVAGETVAGGPYAIQQGTVTNANNPNYTITYVGANLTITVRPIAVTADAKTKVYGDADPALTFTTTSLGTGVPVVGSLTRTAGENIGVYAILQGTVTDANNPNYSITYTGANLTITVRPIAVTADAKTKVYGDADPALTFTTTSLGTGVPIVGSLTRAVGETVGVYAIQQGTVTDANNPNYSITFTSANFTITARAVTVTADAKTKVYGDADPALTFTNSALGTGVPIAGALSRVAGENIGSYAITQGTVTNANNPNYSITYVGANLTITVRPVTVTADAKTKVYGDADPALTFTTTSLGTGVAIAGSLTRVAGETVAGSPYAIQQGTVTNANNPNYTITYVGANLTITVRPITVTADAKTKVYGDADPALTFTTTSLGTGVAVAGALTRVAGETVAGSPYAIQQGTVTNANNPNYSITYVGANLTITVRPVTVTADAKTKVYGDADPALTFTNTSLGTGVAISGALSRVAGETVAGSPYAIQQGTVTNANNPNYSITYIGANLTITARPVTVTAQAAGKIYGDADPALLFTFTSLGTGVPLNGSLARAAGENVGVYAINQGTVTNANNPNYSITFVPANFTITARAVTVTADAKTKVFGAADPALTFTTTSLGTGVPIAGALTRVAGETVLGSPYAIQQGTVTNANNPNYTITYVGANLTITQAATVTMITGDTPDPSIIGNAYVVTWTVTVTMPGAGTPTGTVTVSDGTDSCNAPVAAGTCNLTSNTLGAKTLVATYSGDSNFSGSVSPGVPHQVDCLVNPIVTNNADSGPGSLRLAVFQACDGSTITFAGSVTSPITLTTGDISINKNLTINGPGAAALTISGNNNSRIFTIPGGFTVSMSGLRLTEGNGVGTISTGSGGAIHTQSNLNLNSMVIAGNTAGAAGGGVAVGGGTTSLLFTAVSGNTATGFGGGIRSVGTLNVDKSTISGNTSNASNTGGGIDSSGTLTVTNSTISGNTVSSTNSANGGGIWTGSATTLISNSTITGNTVGGTVGASGLIRAGGVVTVRSSIVAANTNPTTVADTVGTFTSSGYNLIGNVGAATGFGGPADQTGTGAAPINPLLGPLANNGGPTLTHSILSTSPALDRGNAFGQTTDQRGMGFGRVFNQPVIPDAIDGTDVGAYEVQTVLVNPTSTTVTSNLNPSVFGQNVTFTATVASVPPGPIPTGNVSFNVDGNVFCANTPLNGSGVATCLVTGGLPNLPAGNRVVVAIYAGAGSFDPSAGTLAGGQVVNQAATTTTITSHLPNPSLVNQPYTVSWAVAVTGLGSGTPTGTVTVNGGTGGGSCSAPVAAGSCQLTPTTIGVKTISATYNGDNNFSTSTSMPTTHTVNVQISGVVTNGTTSAPVAGMNVALSGCATATATTNGAGAYAFVGQFTGSCTVTPNTMLSEPLSRTYNPVTTNIANADFMIYLTADDFPRKISFATQFTAPGVGGAMPVVLQSLDNEASVAFSFSYDTNPFSQAPTISCGANAPGCTVTTDTSVFGRVGFTIVPAGAGFSRPDGTPFDEGEAAGPKEIARINYISVGTTLPSTDFVPVSGPTAFSIREKVTNNPLAAVYVLPARVVFVQGIEGDTAGRNTGNGTFEATDVIQIRRFVAGLDTFALTHNEFQRADTAPAAVRGNGILDATDVIQTRRYVANLDAPQGAGGPGAPVGVMSPSVERPSGPVSEVKIGDAAATNNSRVSVPVEMTTSGSEFATSFTIRYDARRFENPTVTLGSDSPEGAVLTLGGEPGVIRVLVDSSTAFGRSKDARLLDITFDVKETAASGATPILIDELVFSDKEARATRSNAAGGAITITGPNPTDESRPTRSVKPSIDLIEEWIDGSIIVLRPRVEGEVRRTKQR